MPRPQVPGPARARVRDPRPHRRVSGRPLDGADPARHAVPADGRHAEAVRGRRCVRAGEPRRGLGAAVDGGDGDGPSDDRQPLERHDDVHGRRELMARRRRGRRRGRERAEPHPVLPRPPLVSPRPGGARRRAGRGSPGRGRGRGEGCGGPDGPRRALWAGAHREADGRADGGGDRALAASALPRGDVRLARRRRLGPLARRRERRARGCDRGGRRRGRADDPGDGVVPDRRRRGRAALAAELRAAQLGAVRPLPAVGVRPGAEALGRGGADEGRRGVGAVRGRPRGVRGVGRGAGSRPRRPERHRPGALHAGGAGARRFRPRSRPSSSSSGG